MRKRIKKEEEDIKIRKLYLQDLADKYFENRIDDADVLDYVSKELEELEENERQGFELKILNFLNITTLQNKKNKPK